MAAEIWRVKKGWIVDITNYDMIMMTKIRNTCVGSAHL